MLNAFGHLLAMPHNCAGVIGSSLTLTTVYNIGHLDNYICTLTSNYNDILYINYVIYLDSQLHGQYHKLL